MHSIQSRQSFISSEKGILLREQLEAMVKSPLYNTKISALVSVPQGSRFIEKHMNYMSGFPKMDHMQYVSNLKLMTKIVTK